jgi:hypothetical protein
MTARLGSLVVVLLATGCGGGSAEATELPLREDFADCERFSMNDEVATVDCPQGELRVLVAQPEVSPSHFVPFRFDTKQQGLTVSAEAHAPVAGGAWGIGCLASARGEAGRGYLFLVTGGGDGALMRLDAAAGEATDGRVPQQFDVLSSRRHFIQSPAARHTFRVSCATAAAGTVRLRGTVDGRRPLLAEDDDGIAPFTAASSVVLTDQPGTDVRFDEVSVEGTQAIEPETAAIDQAGRIALVQAAAGKQTANGRVTSVFCQSESSGCVVTFKVEYSAPDCQFWVVKRVDGVDVAKPDGPIREGHGTYDEDDPDAIGCAYGP